MEKGIELTSAFSRFYTQLEESGLIFREVITDYAKASYHNLHSLLNSALIRAGIESGYLAIPEYKLRLKQAITTPRGKNQYFIQVDTAYFKGCLLAGVGEVFTLDEIHGCLPSGAFAEEWQTPWFKLNHLAERFPPIFFIIVNVIPVQAKMPHWKGINQYPLTGWKQRWGELTEGLKRKGAIVHHIIISEQGTSFNQVSHSQRNSPNL